MWAVLAGTFTLRFSTGLTGAMLGGLPRDAPAARRRPEVEPDRRRPLLARRSTSPSSSSRPIFGVLSDRHGPPPGDALRTGLRRGRGHPHRADDQPRRSSAARAGWRAPRRRRASRRSSASSRSSRPRDEGLRGKASARFEGATLLGLGAGFAVAPILFAAFGPTAFFLNAVVYGVSFLIFRTVKDPAGEAAADQGPARRAAPLRRADCGARTSGCSPRPGSRSTPRSACGSASRSSSSPRPTREFPDQALMQRVHGRPDLRPRPSSSGSSSAPGCCTGATASRTCGGRRSSCTGSSAAGRWSGPASSSTTPPACRSRSPLGGRRRSPAFGLFVHGRRDAGRARPAGRHLRALPHDRGAIMGLYSVFLAVGQIIGALIGGFAADARGHRRDAHRHRRPARRRPHPARPAAPRRGRAGRRPDRTDPQTCDALTGRPLDPGPARPRDARGGRRAASPGDRGRARRPAPGRLGGRRGDRDERRPRRSSRRGAAGSVATRSG